METLSKNNLRFNRILYLLTLTFTLLGCGSDPATEADQVFPNYVGNSDEEARVVSMARVSCHNSPLVGSWRAYNQNHTIQNTVLIRDDCLFEDYRCGVVGYLNSVIDPAAIVGLANVVFVDVATPKALGCAPAGNYRCQYDLGAAFYSELTISCIHI
jgi:hypothetical protein